MTLHVDLGLRRGALDVAVAFDVGEGETVALVGPNGAGKTTCLLAIAGLERVQRGMLALDGRVLDGGPEGPFVAPEERAIGVVFQDHLLFPHLSALDNVAYGARGRGGRSRRAARAVAAEWLARVGLDERHHRARPAGLSGGQAQRVALARALASAPRALLFDEPLAAVDASARAELRRELRRHLASFPGPRIVVAHELSDALALADRLVVLEAGCVVQVGTARELARRPRSRYVADLLGVNAYEGRCADHVVEVGTARLTAATDLTGDVRVTFHPRAVSLYRERPAGSPRNVWRARVTGVEPLVDRARVQLGGELPVVAEVTLASVDELALREGTEVWAALKATEVHVAPR